MGYKRVLCPNPHHTEKTPSFVLYPNYGHCFGCGYSQRLDTFDENKAIEEVEKYVEDLDEKITYIKSLPKSSIRGHMLYTDATHYFILWPHDDYYKSSLLVRNENEPKYKGPSGVRKPYFPVRVSGNKTLGVCEGELNALSLSLVTDIDIVSPGSAGDFYSSRLYTDLQLYNKYDKFFIIVDADAAGTKAAIELKSRLLAEGKVDITISLWKEDANDVLMKYGQKELKKRVSEMGMSTRL